MNIEMVREAIRESVRVKTALLDLQAERIAEIGEVVAAALRAGRRLYLCGNGGSAADAQHIAAELVGRFHERERRGLAAVALGTNFSALTAVANDYGYDRVFVRQVDAYVEEGDVVVGISTSGRSRNVLLALEEARRRGATTVAFTGAEPGPMAGAADVVLAVPSTETPRIQESHILAGHIVCECVEALLFDGAG